MRDSSSTSVSALTGAPGTTSACHAPRVFWMWLRTVTGSSRSVAPRGECPVGLAHRPVLEHHLVGTAPLPLGREQEQARRHPVQPVQCRELRQVELVAQPDHDALEHVLAARDRREERRLVDDDDAVVAMDDVERTGHLDLVAQVAVEPHERVREVGVVARATGRPSSYTNRPAARKPATSTRSGSLWRSQSAIVDQASAGARWRSGVRTQAALRPWRAGKGECGGTSQTRRC